jgi:hypothetical protein
VVSSSHSYQLSSTTPTDVCGGKSRCGVSYLRIDKELIAIGYFSMFV